MIRVEEYKTKINNMYSLIDSFNVFLCLKRLQTEIN